jgi:hypothetical protein
VIKGIRVKLVNRASRGFREMTGHQVLKEKKATRELLDLKEQVELKVLVDLKEILAKPDLKEKLDLLEPAPVAAHQLPFQTEAPHAKHQRTERAIELSSKLFFNWLHN